MLVVIPGVALTIAWSTFAQENAPQQQIPGQELQRVHGPRSIDQELEHLTKDLQLTPQQREQVRPLLEEHHNKIQVLLDKNPTLSREALAPQIHAISDETHHEIESLLTKHQKQLAKAMQKRMHDSEETRHSRTVQVIGIAFNPTEATRASSILSAQLY